MEKSYPAWPVAAIRRFLDYVEQNERLLHLSMQGISQLQALPGIVEAIANFEQGGPQERGEKNRVSLDLSKTIASFAQNEVTSGFPLLHAHTLIGTWGAFEAAIEDTLVSFLLNKPELLQQESFAKLRIPLADFELLEREERMRFLIAELERSQGFGRKIGIEKCEALLEPLGLSGPVDRDIKKDVREMNHVRNVLVHRASIADRRLIEGCPWLNLKTGELISVKHEDLVRYERALCTYVTALIYRILARLGVPPDVPSCSPLVP